MGNLSGYDASKYETTDDFDVLPPAEYRAAIVASEMKTTKSGTGKYLKLEFQIVDGKFKGRKLWANLNIHNANDTAMQIARAELSSICRAVGVLTPGDSSELHDKPMLIRVIVEDSPRYGKQNRIRGYRQDANMKVASEINQAASQPAQLPADEIPF